MSSITKNRKKAFTMMEVIVTIGLFVLLSGAVYSIFSSFNKSFKHSQDKLDILLTTRIIMAGLRNDLRNCIDKPQGINDRLSIPVSPTRVVQYYFDKENRRLYRGSKTTMADPDPDVSEMKPFLFGDGQILEFSFDFSHTNDDTWYETQFTLNTSFWVKVLMRILYTEKYDKLTEADKAQILENPDDDPRVKSFFMIIAPRLENWKMKTTQ